MSKQGILKMNKLAQKSFPKVTGNGVWGDPTNSSARLGKKIIEGSSSITLQKSQT